MQTEVAAEIAVALERELFPPPAARSEAPTRVPGAHEAYLTGRFHWNRSGPIGHADRHRLLRSGARPRSRLRPRPFVARPRLPLVVGVLRRADAGDALRSARDAAERALAIDPDDGDAWVVIAEARRVLDHDPAGARAAYEKVLSMNPSSECALRYYAWFLGARSPGAEAIAVADRAFSLDPLCIVMQTCAADVHYLVRRLRGGAVPQPARAGDGAGVRAGDCARRRWPLVQLGRGEDAVAIFDAVPERSASLTSLAIKGCALVAAGNVDRARAIARRLERAGQDRVVSPYHLAALHNALGDHDAAFAQLERACAAGDGWLDAVGVDPRFACLRDDDRLHALRARLRLD